jgi:excisionase family DNA binding protein
MNSSIPTLDRLYFTPAELAELYKVSERTVFRWNSDGEIAFVKVGQTVRYPLSSVIDFEARHSIRSRGQTDPGLARMTLDRLESIARAIRQREREDRYHQPRSQTQETA